MASWRQKLYMNLTGKEIPYDSFGQRYEIHHIDGDQSNNSIENLECISIREHFQRHFDKEEYMQAWAVMSRMKKEARSEEEYFSVAKLASNSRDNSKLGFSIPEIKQKMISLQSERIKNGSFHLLGGEIQRKSNKERIKNKTHNFIQPEFKDFMSKENKKRLKDGTHPFLNPENRSDWVLSFKICSYCGYKGRGIGFLYNHEEYCISNPNNSRIACEHCGKSNHPAVYKRYHGTKCKFK